MAKYSDFKYGTNEKYGASAISEDAPIKWIVLVDWDDDGVMSGESEAGRLTNIKMTAGRHNYLNTRGNGFEHMRPASCTLKMDNHDRRYDARYASSPLYPNIKTGHKIILRVRDNDSGLLYSVFTGILDDIVPVSARGGGDVYFECVGYLQNLFDTDLTSSAAMLDTTITDALYALLDDVHFPINTWLDTDDQPVITFGVHKKTAGKAAMELADAALGTFFVNKLGHARFYSRNHSGWTEHNIDQSQIGVEILINRPWAGVFNQIKVVSNNQIYQQGSVIFTLSTPVRVEVGTPVTIYPKYPPARDVEMGSIEGNTDADGNGEDISEDLSYTASLNMAGGSVIVSTTTTGYITKLEIRGRIFDSSAEEFSETDGSNDETYGLRCFNLDTPYLQDRNYASEFVSILGSDNDFLYTAREAPVITIEGRPDLQFAVDLMDKVNLTAAALDINATYYILGIEHKGTPQRIITVLYLDMILQDSTAITPAPVETAQQQAPTGYKNPAGDPTTIGADPTMPNSFCSVYGDIPSGLTASANTYPFEFTDVHSDPDGLFKLPSDTFVVPISGYYKIELDARVWFTYEYSADDDETGLCAILGFFYIYINDVVFTPTTHPVSACRFYRVGLFDFTWQAHADPQWRRTILLEKDDEVTFLVGHQLVGKVSNPMENFIKGMVNLNIEKIRGV